MDRSCAVRSRLTLHGNCAASVSRRLDPLLELLQQSGPAAIDILAHRLTRLRAHLLELAVFEQMGARSEEHTAELQSQSSLVCRLLLAKTIYYPGPGESR